MLPALPRPAAVTANASELGVLGFVAVPGLRLDATADQENSGAGAFALPPHAVLVAWEGVFVDHTLQKRPNGSHCAHWPSSSVDLPLPPVFDYRSVLAWPTLLADQKPSDDGAKACVLDTTLGATPYHERIPFGKTHYDVMPGGVRYTAALAVVEALFDPPSSAHALRFGVPALLWLLEHGPVSLRVLLPRNSSTVEAALDAVGSTRIWDAWRRGQQHQGRSPADSGAADALQEGSEAALSWRNLSALTYQEPAPAFYWAYRAFFIFDGTLPETRHAGSALPVGRECVFRPGAGALMPPLCDATRQWVATLVALLPPIAPPSRLSCTALADAQTMAWLLSPNAAGRAFMGALEARGLAVASIEDGGTAGEVPLASLWLLARGTVSAEVAFAHPHASIAWIALGEYADFADDDAQLYYHQDESAQLLCSRVARCFMLRPSPGEYSIALEQLIGAASCAAS